MNTEIQTIESNDAQSTMMALISKAATSDSIDADKLEKLLAVQERWEANQAKKAYGRAMADFRASVGRIKKTRQAHNSQYAGLAETIDAVKNVLAENGLSHSWRTEQDGNAVSVTCIISHVDGHSEKTSLASSPDTSGSKNSIQAIGSAVSYLQRYTLFSILGLASGDHDDDGAGTGPSEKVQPAMDMQRFNNNIEQYEHLITSGQHSAEDVIRQLQTRYTLSAEQKAKLKYLEPKKQGKTNDY